MSHSRYARKVDSSQAAIVEALREAGILVWIISRPCDLLTFYPPLKRWRTLECKPAAQPGIKVKVRAIRNRKDQKKQDEFLAITGTPIVRTAQEAITAVIH